MPCIPILFVVAEVEDSMRESTLVRVIVTMSLITGAVFAGNGLVSAQGDATAMALEAQRVELPDGAGEALYWEGDEQAVIFAHGAVYDAASWTEQAKSITSLGFSVLAVEDISAEAIMTAKGWMLEEKGASGIVVIGASAGGGGALSALATDSSSVAGLVLMGATGSVDGLGDYPKLFTASEGEGMSDRLETMADEASGDANQVTIIPGDAHAQATFKNPEGEQLLDAIIGFLEDDAAWPDDDATPAA